LHGEGRDSLVAGISGTKPLLLDRTKPLLNLWNKATLARQNEATFESLERSHSCSTVPEKEGQARAQCSPSESPYRRPIEKETVLFPASIIPLPRMNFLSLDPHCPWINLKDQANGSLANGRVCVIEYVIFSIFPFTIVKFSLFSKLVSQEIDQNRGSVNETIYSSNY
jgi:hypothetical protein